ncbi:MAG: hypothetical protein AAF998_26285 [Bacteroidota bacterium]
MRTQIRTSLRILALCLASFGLLAASTPKKKHRRFLPKKAIPTHVELVIGGYGAHADRYARKDHFHPFGDFMIGAKVYTADNKVYGTAGIGGGIFSWDNFHVEVIGGTFKHALFKRSNVRIAHPDDVPGHRIRLRVAYKALPHIVREVELPLDFSYSYTLRAAGIDGSDGWEECRRAPGGSDGSDHEKCDGEDGQFGYHGAPGGIGAPGQPGPDIEVILLPYDDLNSDDPVIEARERNLHTGRTRTRWYTPLTNTLTITSIGGDGGCGGDGQAGGHGGDGGDGGREGDEEHKPVRAYGGNGGNGGFGGHGGDGGAGGPGGQITVFFHPDLKNYLGSVRVASLGGDGGRGGDGGAGGRAGNGGAGNKGDGNAGQSGACGPEGFAGPQGFAGPPVEWIALEP